MTNNRYKINDIEYDVRINSLTEDHAEVNVNGVAYQVEILRNIRETEQVIGVSSVPDTPAPEDNPAPAQINASGVKSVCSPLPGVLISVNVKAGDRVRAGQVIAVLEAMKMENEIQSEYDGTVTSVNVVQGDSILEGETIITIG